MTPAHSVESVARLVEEAEALAGKASEAPWVPQVYGEHDCTVRTGTVDGFGGDPVLFFKANCSNAVNDAVFTARSRTLVPELAQALREATAEVERLREALVEARAGTRNAEGVADEALRALLEFVRQGCPGNQRENVARLARAALTKGE